MLKIKDAGKKINLKSTPDFGPPGAGGDAERLARSPFAAIGGDGRRGAGLALVPDAPCEGGGTTSRRANGHACP
jgi:hypothetical protein